MARQPRDPRASLDRPGQRPLLQGHLRRGGRPDPTLNNAPSAADQGATPATPDVPDKPPAEPVGGGAAPAEPTTPGGGDAEAARGKATKTPADVATRPHLEGSEQGPS